MRLLLLLLCVAGCTASQAAPPSPTAPRPAPQPDAAPFSKPEDYARFAEDTKDILSASMMCFDLLREIDAYETKGCECYPPAMSPPPAALRSIREKTRVLNWWVRNNTKWKHRGKWIMDR